MKTVQDYLPKFSVVPPCASLLWRDMAEKGEGSVVQQDKTGKSKQAENKGQCVTCQHHVPKGHGEWGVCVVRHRWRIIRVPGFSFGCNDINLVRPPFVNSTVFGCSDDIWIFCTGSIIDSLACGGKSLISSILCKKDVMGQINSGGSSRTKAQRGRWASSKTLNQL